MSKSEIEGESFGVCESAGGREDLMTVEPPALCPAVTRFTRN